MTPRYILTRSITALLVIVAALYAISFVKTKQRRDSIVAELKSLSSESSFFRQFSPEDARKALVRAVGLIAEAEKTGITPELAIDRGLGIEVKYFKSDDDREPTIAEVLIRSTLRANYENFKKLGYEGDFHTLESMGSGELPTVRTGRFAGKKAEVGTIIDPALSPGLDTVLANLEIRPKRDPSTPPTDVETAIARRLATDLFDAGVIEETAKNRILSRLSGKE